ncbi:AlpA family transcriptional regulator [Hyphomicrobium sp.]|uniref:helix-turn-helix transcriptional regulator n=1 Tax=Hyphomicrobium sp. TaxID=82 RepID=UPI0025BF899A|nr:AlpA family transcriptional regulator [Hyphomicrobium sp.]MCC7253179.1 AlpA family transcriptional regulator [Hyphomicrobium sp.]
MALAIVDDTPSPAAQRLILRRDVEYRTGLPRSTLYEMIKAGLFPRPVQLTPRLSAFVESEVDEWIAQRIATRGGDERTTPS